MCGVAISTLGRRLVSLAAGRTPNAERRTMDTLIRDIQFAIRSLAKSKLFTLVAVLSLALGIGANVTVFSVVNSLAFKPLPYTDPDRLVDVSEWSATKLCEGCGVGTSFDTFLDWRATARSFSGMGAYIERPFSVSGTETAERVGGALVSAETFEILGKHPALGRGFVADDDKIGAPPAVLLSDGLWRRRYGADQRIVGQTIRVNGLAHVVIGVMPPNFNFPEFAQLWLPFVPNAAGTPRGQRDFAVVARLATGASMGQADAEMAVIAKGIESRFPDVQKEWTARVTSFRSSFEAMPPSMFAAMLGAVGFVLLIVCANLAGLVLARGTGRQREIAIRLALGATRRQIVRHLLTESLILSCAGGALALLLAVWGVDAAVKAIGTQAPFYIDFSLDRTALAFCVGVSIFTGVLFGLFPALRASAPDVHSTLKEVSTTVRRSHARGLLVIGELALAMILLAGAGILMKSFLRISRPDDGYDDRQLLTGNFEFLDAKYADRNTIRTTVEALLARVAQIPAVAGAATQRSEFIAGFGREDRGIRVAGLAAVPDGVSPRFYHVVSPDYFATVRLPIISGRGFTNDDRLGSPRVVLINKQMAETLWPGVSPLGKQIKLGAADSLPWVSVIGVVGNVISRGRAPNYAYVPTSQEPGDRATLLVRAKDDRPLELIPAVLSAVRAVDPDLPLLGLQTVAQQRRANYWPYEMYSLAMGIFAVFAILLAAVGLYGVIAYNMAQRTREIGVRIAIGAEAKHIVALVARDGGRLVVLGIVLGIGGSALLLRALGAMLFGASPIDIPIFAAVSVLLAAVAFAAIWAPALRAARVSPLEALRAE